MLGEALNGVIGPIFETTWNVLKNQYDAGLKDTDLKQKRLQLQQTTEGAARTYHQKYLDRHCNVKVLPGLMKEAMPLDTIYTAVKFLGDSDLKYFSTLDDLEEMYRQSGKRRFRVGSDERQDGLEAAKQEQYLMVLGGPGVGKSTFLRKLGLEALKGNLAHELMPVFIELKSFKSEEQTIAQAIAKELEIAGFPGPEILVELLLSEGKMLVLLDGLDEVPAKQENAVIEQIRDFCDQYSQNHFVASCRIAAYKGGFNRFIDVTMAEFDDEQIEQFANRWFSSNLDCEDKTAQRFLGTLQQPENLSAKELGQTPLLLTFLCLVYDRSQSLPTVRSTLYGDALNILLKEWAAEKRLEQDPIYQGFHTDLEKELLAEIAYESFLNDQLFFSRDEITERITSFLEDTLDAPKHLNAFNVLRAIERQQGVLVERATDAYSFSHLTLQEYLVAKNISSQGIITEIVVDYLADERWREIFLLLSGLLGKRSYELLEAMQKAANSLICYPKLIDLLKWADKCANTTVLGQKLVVKASVIGCLEGFEESALEIAMSSLYSTNKVKLIALKWTSSAERGISVDAIDAASLIVQIIAPVLPHDGLDKAGILVATDSDVASLTSSLEEQLEQVQKEGKRFNPWHQDLSKVNQIYFQSFSIDDDLLDLTDDEMEAFDNYLYAVQLIIDCKDAAVRVSRQQWQAIESQLLAVPVD